MKVSVIIPHFNTSDLLVRAIESVEAQTCEDMDLTVVDDGSNTMAERNEALKLFSSSTVVKNVWIGSWRTRGQGHSLNDGVHASGGEYLAFLDADDVWVPTKLRKQVQVLDERPEISVVCCHAREFAGLRGPEGHVAGEPKPARLTSALVVRRSAFARIGEFREDLGAGMTIEWFSRVEDSGEGFYMHPETLFYRRIHDRNYGVVRRAEAQSEYIRGLKVISDRRRGRDAER